MSEKCPLKEIQERSGKLLDRWALKVDNVFDKASLGLDKAAKWTDENIPFAGELLSIREHGKEIDELLGEYHKQQLPYIRKLASLKSILAN